jgi:hypothetical protein
MKGSLDLIIGVVMLFSLLIVFILGNGIWDTASAAVSDELNTTVTQDIFEYTSTTYNMLDGLYFIVVIGICMGAILSSFMVETHPIFFLAMMLSNMGLIVINVHLSNAFSEFATSSSMITASANEFSLSVAFMNALPVIALVVSFIAAAVLYGKGKL